MIIAARERGEPASSEAHADGSSTSLGRTRPNLFTCTAQVSETRIELRHTIDFTRRWHPLGPGHNGVPTTAERQDDDGLRMSTRVHGANRLGRSPTTARISQDIAPCPIAILGAKNLSDRIAAGYTECPLRLVH